MDTLSRQELTNLIESQGGLHVSVYMPTHRAGREIQQDPIRLKNTLAKVENELTAFGMRLPDAVSLLKPARDLLEDGLYWQHSGDGLALFLVQDEMKTYQLPHHFEELTVVDERFHITPLLPHFFGTDEFYVLVLSQNAVHLYRANRYSISEIQVEDMPHSLAEALKYDDFERELQFHTRTATPSGGERAGTFFGTGAAAADNQNTNLLRYFQQVARGVDAFLRDSSPLVLAGVNYLHPIYKEASSYPHIMQEGIGGSGTKIEPEELRVEAWKIVAPHLTRDRDEALTLYAELKGNNSPRAAYKLGTILQAAHEGRVQVLFVRKNERQWGTYTPGTNQAQVHENAEPEDTDLYDLAAAHTMKNGGTVYVVEVDQMPDGEALAAIYYY